MYWSLSIGRSHSWVAYCHIARLADDLPAHQALKFQQVDTYPAQDMLAGMSKEQVAGSTLPELQSFRCQGVETHSSLRSWCWNDAMALTGYATLMMMMFALNSPVCNSLAANKQLQRSVQISRYDCQSNMSCRLDNIIFFLSEVFS